MLEVEARPALLKFPNLQHLGTRVRGTLAGGGTPKSALALAAAVHPPAAVCGTPTGAALDLIRELEHMDRERYAGPVGWMDAEGNGEWGIAIRCAQLSGRTARLFAGCGIVAGSEPAAELAETLVKLQPMRGALEGRGLIPTPFGSNDLLSRTDLVRAQPPGPARIRELLICGRLVSDQDLQSV